MTTTFAKFVKFVESLEVTHREEFEADFGRYRNISSEEGLQLIKSKMSYLPTSMETIAKFFAYKYGIIYTDAQLEKFGKWLRLIYYL